MAGKKWIQRAVKKPGALSEYAQRVGCLRSDGRISIPCLERYCREHRCSTTTIRRINLAKTLISLRRELDFDPCREAVG